VSRANRHGVPKAGPGQVRASGPVRAHTIVPAAALSRFRFILIEPRRGANVGTASRGLKNFGFSQLWTMGGAFEWGEARGAAVQSEELIDGLKPVAEGGLGRALPFEGGLAQALAGCSLVVGTTPRQSAGRNTPDLLRDALPALLAPVTEEAAALNTAGSGDVAILFGPEWRGLSDEELFYCSRVISIPTAPEQPSLNLAQAVTVVAYELFAEIMADALAAGTGTPDLDPFSLTAPHDELQGLFGHIRQTLIDLNFLAPQGHFRLEQSIRDFISRARPNRREVTVLRGILAKVQYWRDERAAERRARRGLPADGAAPSMVAPNAADVGFMERALFIAREAAARGDVPVGAVCVLDGKIIGEGGNAREQSAADFDPTAHAEVVALREAAKTLGAWRLNGATLYVTLEPCPMCTGALINARVRRVVYGARDAKAGAVTSLYQLATDQRLNHRLQVTEGVCAAESADLLKVFFEARRGLTKVQ
jgi:tRNA(adenine34) deaminase